MVMVVLWSVLCSAVGVGLCVLCCVCVIIDKRMCSYIGEKESGGDGGVARQAAIAAAAARAGLS